MNVWITQLFSMSL